MWILGCTLTGKIRCRRENWTPLESREVKLDNEIVVGTSVCVAWYDSLSTVCARVAIGISD